MRRLSILLLAALVLLGSAPATTQAGDEPTSLVDWLKWLGQDASFGARTALYDERYPGERYTGSLEQNVKLFETLREERAAGRFPPAGGAPALPPPERRPGGAGSTPPAVPTPSAPPDVAPPDPVAPTPTEPGPVPRDRRVPRPPRPVDPEDTPPPSDTPPVPVRTIDAVRGWLVVVDPRDQVVNLDVMHRTARGEGAEGEREARVTATLPVVGGFVSAAMLVQKAKVFDDGLYAAVELAAQEGAGRFRGKRALLDALRAKLFDVAPEAVGPGTAVPFVAARAGGANVPVPPALLPIVSGQLQAFDATPVLSKPIGFYTWSDALRSIFRQDRIVQPPLPPGPHLDALVRALHGDPASRATYEGYLALVERLTNPFVAPDLRPALAALDRGEPLPTDRAAFVPACRSAETEMLKRLDAAGVDTRAVIAMDAFVAGVRDGSVSLAVRQDSGWYDRQQGALEPFLRPETTAEARRVTWGDAYRQRMEQLFRGALALARETHIKHLDIFKDTAGGVGFPSPVRVTVTPALTVEPHPTAWLRRADTYRYVRGLLERVFGKEGLETMRRQTPEGPVTVPLGEELVAFERLFTGAYARACAETGTPAGGLPGLDVADTAFASWAQQTATDPDLARDVRMMVPVSVDPESGRVRVWCFLGWATDDLAIHFATPPVVTRRRTGTDVTGAAPEVTFAPQTATAAYPVFAETWTTKVLDRAEFRRLCDEKRTKAAILEALR
jgi:hypothetical protein